MECVGCRVTGAERTCARCKAAYCGAQCQREDWKAGHKATCNHPTCYICLDDEDPESVCAMGCACTRGGAGYAHVSCMIRLVDEQTKHNANPLRWTECFVCKHQYNGVMLNSLVEAYHAKNPDDLISGKAIIMTMIHTSREREAMKLASHYRDMCFRAAQHRGVHRNQKSRVLQGGGASTSGVVGTIKKQICCHAHQAVDRANALVPGSGGLDHDRDDRFGAHQLG